MSLQVSLYISGLAFFIIVWKKGIKSEIIKIANRYISYWYDITFFFKFANFQYIVGPLLIHFTE